MTHRKKSAVILERKQKRSKKRKLPSAGVYLGFFKWGGTAPPLPARKWGGQWHPKIQSGGALFKKVQKWGGTRSSAPPLPGLKYTPGGGVYWRFLTDFHKFKLFQVTGRSDNKSFVPKKAYIHELKLFEKKFFFGRTP